MIYANLYTRKSIAMSSLLSNNESIKEYNNAVPQKRKDR